MKYFALAVALILLLPTSTFAQNWVFTAPIDVTTRTDDNYYHHLESAGRRNIAVSEDTVAIVWEDDRTGMPKIYLALKNINDSVFAKEIIISGAGEAYEPSIVAMDENRFAISWEEDGKIFVRSLDASSLKKPLLSKVLKLSGKQAMQASIAAHEHRVYVVYSDQAERFGRIRLAQLDVNPQQSLSLLEDCLIDPQPVKDQQLYPTAVIAEHRIIIAWEDRRQGHTIIMATQSQPDRYCDFSPPERISKRPGNRKLPYGKGHGVARVALAPYGQSDIMAAWADKRNFREGYDIFASGYEKSGQWGDNIRVQDEFGGEARQWHTTIAGHSNGFLIAAWSDEREESTDIFFSGFDKGEWSEDVAMPGASGTGEQNHPTITFDKAGNLHVAWILRHETGGPTQLKYMFGRLNQVSQ